jgi:PiT family inorganic phosphate transporter
LEKVLAALLFSPFIGMAAGYIIVKMLIFLARPATPHINVWFKRGQILTATTLALSHGSNDGQKTIGIIALGLVATGDLKTFAIPQWVIFAGALSMGLGTFFGAGA